MNRILIRSEDRNVSTDTPSRFRVNLRQNIDAGKYVLKELAIYNTLYSIIAGRNDRVYTSLGNVALTAGNYSTVNIAAMVQTRLRTIDNSFTITYSSTTNKLTFTCSNSFYFTWASSTGDDAAKLLGFPLADTSAGLTVDSTNIINLNQTRGIFIAIQQADATTSIKTTNSTTDSMGHFYIPISVEYGRLIISNSKQCIKLDRTQSLTISLFDDSGRLLDLNSTEWSMLLDKEGT